MPFVTYFCKNPTPHKTVVFVPASAMGSFTPGAGGGNNGGQSPGTAGSAQAIITCPQCAFTAQPGDGQMSSVANGMDGCHQERSIIKPAAGDGSPPSNEAFPVVAPNVADSGVRIPINSPGDTSGGNLRGAGSTQYRLDSAGVKNLL